jgi:CarboxypepD_reg-like domain
MKTIYLTLIFFAFSFTLIQAQETKRVEVIGRIIVKNPDVEGVTVYNTSSNRGTITDEEGRFKIKVALNDRIEISALQFKDFKITIDSEIIKSKALTVFLIEEVNKLPEIILLPYGLSGDLPTDIANTNTVNPDLDALYFGLDNLDKIDFTADYLSGIRNTAMNDNTLYYSADAIKIIGLLFKPIFNSKSKKNKNLDNKATEKEITKKYSNEYLMERLNIPKTQIVEFVYYVEDSGLDKELLKNGRELEFLDYLIKRSKEFQSIKNDKN